LQENQSVSQVKLNVYHEVDKQRVANNVYYPGVTAIIDDSNAKQNDWGN
jgi:hypothetical protein